MKILEPSFEIIDLENQLTPAQKIERVGRVCYKSEAKVTDSSAGPFVKSLIQNGHEAMLEHASLLFLADQPAFFTFRQICNLYEEHTGKPCFIKRDAFCCYSPNAVSGNIRAWRDMLRFVHSGGGWPQSRLILPSGMEAIYEAYPDLFSDIPRIKTSTLIGYMHLSSYKKLGRPSHTNGVARHVPLTVKFNVDIAVARELCRHRLASHAGESTRYCAYDQGKFGSETSVIAPETSINADFVRAAKYAEEKYFSQRSDGKPPEIARSCLTLATKCEHVVTATLDEWERIFALRALEKTGKVHPQMKQVMLPLYQECVTLWPYVFGEAK